jgi:GxxExxY protein
MRVELESSLEELTGRIIGAAFEVSRTLGHGFLEAVYQNALVEELAASGLAVVKEKAFPVHYRGKQVGMYLADIVIENTVIAELKVAQMLIPAHAAQVLNYLRASRLPVGLLFNFGKPKVEFRRVIL